MFSRAAELVDPSLLASPRRCASPRRAQLAPSSSHAPLPWLEAALASPGTRSSSILQRKNTTTHTHTHTHTEYILKTLCTHTLNTLLAKFGVGAKAPSPCTPAIRYTRKRLPHQSTPRHSHRHRHRRRRRRRHRRRRRRRRLRQRAEVQPPASGSTSLSSSTIASTLERPKR